MFLDREVTYHSAMTDRSSWRQRLRPVLFPIWRLLRIWSNHFSRGNLPQWVKQRRQEISGDVLNVGAGGELAALVQPCLSIDIDPKRAPDRVVDVCCLDAEFDAAQFDAVFLIEVLEHVQDPQRALAQIERVLKPGGRLVFSVPFSFEMHDTPYDFWRFTQFGLARLLTPFEDVQINRRNGYVRAAFTPLTRLWLSPHWPDRLIGVGFLLLAVPLYPLIWLADQCIKSEALATGYHVTARKKPEGN